MRSQQQKFFLLILLLLVSSLWLFYMISKQLVAGRPQLTIDAHQQKPRFVPSDKTDARVTRNWRVSAGANGSSDNSVCHTPQCIAKFESVANRPNRIPPIRHILWKGDKVSSYFAKQLKTWSAIHPNWTYVLWRDSDIDRFVATHYTGLWRKFRSLSHYMMRIDMIRYIILHRFGGVYADLDYVLVRPLDRFLKFPAIVTQEVEAHSLFHFGMDTWPPPVLGNPAFMMSEPGHPFLQFCILQLTAKADNGNYYTFAGPMGLSTLLKDYTRDFKAARNPDGVVYVPASRNFYAFEKNNMASSTSRYKDGIIHRLRNHCAGLKKNSSTVAKSLTAYCRDVNNLDPITDPKELVYAIHDSNKSHSSYDPGGAKLFHENLVDIRSVLPNVVMGDTIN